MIKYSSLLLVLMGAGCAPTSGAESPPEIGQRASELSVLRFHEPQGRHAGVEHHAIDIVRRKLLLLESYFVDCPDISCNVQTAFRVLELDLDRSSGGESVLVQSAWLPTPPRHLLRGSSVSKDGATLYIAASLEGDGTIYRKEPSTSRWTAESLPKHGYRNSFHLSDDGQTFLRRSDFAIATGPDFSTRFSREGAGFRHGAVSPSGRWCAVEEHDGPMREIDILRVLDCRTGEVKHRSQTDRFRNVEWVSVQNGLRFIGENALLSTEVGQLELYDFDGERLTLRATFPKASFLAEGEHFLEANVDAAQTMLAFISTHGRLGIIDLAEGTLRAAPLQIPLTNRNFLATNTDLQFFDDDKLFVRTHRASASYILQVP